MSIDLTRDVLHAALIAAVRERDEARARLAAVVAECDRIEADANAGMVVNSVGVPFWPKWAERATARRIRAVAQGYGHE